MQRSGALVDLGKTLGEEELVASFQDGCRQRWRRVEKVKSGLVVKVPYRHQKPLDITCASHGDRVLLCSGMTLCVQTPAHWLHRIVK